MEYSGAGGKLIHKKNQKQKSRDTVPLREKYLYDGNGCDFRVSWRNFALVSSPNKRIEARIYFTISANLMPTLFWQNIHICPNSF